MRSVGQSKVERSLGYRTWRIGDMHWTVSCNGVGGEVAQTEIMEVFLGTGSYKAWDDIVAERQVDREVFEAEPRVERVGFSKGPLGGHDGRSYGKGESMLKIRSLWNEVE